MARIFEWIFVVVEIRVSFMVRKVGMSWVNRSVHTQQDINYKKEPQLVWEILTTYRLFDGKAFVNTNSNMCNFYRTSFELSGIVKKCKSRRILLGFWPPNFSQISTSFLNPGLLTCLVYVSTMDTCSILTTSGRI